MDLSVAAFLGLLVATALLRGVELVISRRHQHLLVARGVRKAHDRDFRWMVLLHAGVLVGAALEVVVLKRPFIPVLAATTGALVLIANAMRWWVIRTLGLHWNVEVMDSAHLGVLTGGPFRLVRHPNYAAVFIELTALPLIHTAWLTALVGCTAHVWVLSRRVAIEEAVLLSHPAYRATMAHKPRFVPKLLAALLAAALLLSSRVLSGEPVTVRYTEGLVHGFLALRTLDGSLLASGDLIQVARGNRVTSRLVFHFKDDSLHEETTVFSQGQHFQLLTDHLVQKGPAFPQPLDMSIDGASGQVTVRYVDEHGQQKVESEHLDLPPDLANGLIPTLLKNVRPNAPPKHLSLVAATPKPRLVQLAIATGGEESFSTDGATRRATHYVLKVEIGGIPGLIAPLIGKQPPDSQVWILGGEAPAFVKSEQPLYLGGPLWRIELVSPVWPRTPTAQ
jgi:isoprenylcysteine carboxyl methyltransferase (ICMT) family protein YpbQ